MLEVKILINGQEIHSIYAVRQEAFEKRSQIYTYKINGTNHKIRHKYSDGAKKLAIKMLKV